MVEAILDISYWHIARTNAFTNTFPPFQLLHLRYLLSLDRLERVFSSWQPQWEHLLFTQHIEQTRGDGRSLNHSLINLRTRQRIQHCIHSHSLILIFRMHHSSLFPTTRRKAALRSTRLQYHHSDFPFRRQLRSNSLCKALQRELAGVVPRFSRKGHPASDTTYIHDCSSDLTSPRVSIAENSNSFASEMHRPPEIRLHHTPQCGLRKCFSNAKGVDAGIVNHHIDAAELLKSGGKGGINGGGASDIDRKFEDVGIIVREVGKGGGVASCGDEAVILGDDMGCDGSADAGRAPCDWKVSDYCDACSIAQDRWPYRTRQH